MNLQAQAGEQAQIVTAMPSYRIDAFRRVVAAHLRHANENGTDPARMIATLTDENRALSIALGDATLRNTLIQDFRKAMRSLGSSENFEVAEPMARSFMDGILANRIRDAKGYVQLLGDKAFLATARAEALQSAPEKKAYEIPAVKQEEVIRRLVQPMDPEGAEPAVHVGASALGQSIVHEALALTYTSADTRAAVTAALANAWPTATPKQHETLAGEWLTARYNPAHAIAEQLKPNGKLYASAMALSEDIQAQKNVKAAAAPQPATQPAAPVALSAREREKQKTQADRAEDIAYTINHAISCLTTDVLIAPTISALFGINVGCFDHDHKHDDHKHGDHKHDDHGHSHAGPEHHDHPPKKLTWAKYREVAGHYFRGEVWGDTLAVPLTILTQRWAPGFVEKIEHWIEPYAGKTFRSGAQKSAERWADKHGLSYDNVEVVDRAEEIYKHEMKHLPQAVLWNLFSFPIGVYIQKKGGHDENVWKIAGVKAIGALVSNGMLLGGRALAPATAERIDEIDSKYLITPATKILGAPFGVKSETIDRIKHEKPRGSNDNPAPSANDNWQTRVRTAQNAEPAASIQQ